LTLLFILSYNFRQGCIDLAFFISLRGEAMKNLNLVRVSEISRLPMKLPF